MLRRYLGSASAAAAVTFGLFFLMQFLISMEAGERDEIPKGPVIDFVRLERAPEVQEKRREKPKLEKPDRPPPPPDMSMADVPRPEQGALDIAAPAAAPDVDLGGGPALGSTTGNSEVVPLVRVSPQYPMRAAQRRIEGWVVVEFRITAAGTVKDPEVLAAEPKGIFERAAIQAIRKWKYRPKTVDGEPVEQEGVKVKLDFRLKGNA